MTGRRPIAAFFAALTIALLIQGCGESESLNDRSSTAPDVQALAKEVLAHRRSAEQTDVLARRVPDLDRNTAIAIQLAMLEIEQSNGEKLVGWKMGGTGVTSVDKFDPIFGYILESNDLQAGDTFSLSRAPGESLKVEAEVGFVLSRDLVGGVQSVEELAESVAYVLGVIEIVQPVVIGREASPANLEEVVASGVANLAVIRGSVQVPLDGFEELIESAACEVNGVIVAQGDATKIYGGPLNALFALANLLPQHGTYLEKGQLVIAGSVYKNPIVDSAAEVTVTFSTLGEIRFQVGAVED